MFRKAFLILCLFSFLIVSAQEQLLTAGINYNEATARIEAFKDIERKIDKSIFENYLVDPNYKENMELMENNISGVENERYLCPFYFQKTLFAYAVIYDNNSYLTLYYNILGHLARFDILNQTEFPRKTVGYSRYGNIMNVSFEVNDDEQFIYNKNGKLISHWIGDTVYDDENKLPKFLKITRGVKE